MVTTRLGMLQEMLDIMCPCVHEIENHIINRLVTKVLIPVNSTHVSSDTIYVGPFVTPKLHFSEEGKG